MDTPPPPKKKKKKKKEWGQLYTGLSSYSNTLNVKLQDKTSSESQSSLLKIRQ